MARQLFSDPYASQAIDLLQQPAKARAAALDQIANAQARAAEISGNAQAGAIQQGGQAWAGAANQIGQTIGNIPNQIQQARMASLQQQNMQGQIADRAAQQKERDRQNAAAAAGEAAIRGAVNPETGEIDHEKAATDWEKAGFPVQANAYRESLQKTAATAQQLTEGAAKIEAGKRQVQEAATNHMGELALVGLNSLKDATPLEARDKTMGLIANAAAHGVLNQDDAKSALMQTAQASPEQLAGIFQKYLDAAPAVKEKSLKDALTQSEISKNTAQASKELQPPTPTEATLDAAAQAILAKPENARTAIENASLKAYQDRKRTVSDPAQLAASDRQASTQAQQNAIQQNAQTFQQQQAGRKELTEKVEQPYQNAIAQVNTLRDVVSAAKAGNKVAGSLQSLETTMAAIRASGLNRINTAEIGVTANAGSLWDRIVGGAGRLVAGQPVPPDLQKDMTEFANILEKSAAKKYDDAFASTTTRYGLKDEKSLTGAGIRRYNPATGKVE